MTSAVTHELPTVATVDCASADSAVMSSHDAVEPLGRGFGSGAAVSVFPHIATADLTRTMKLE
jgi:hypothetical protein